jgi:NADH dehydrogenase
MSNRSRKRNADQDRPAPRTVIVGANFAGLTAAMNLPGTFDVTVIDSRPHFEFLPNIHELLSDVKKPQNLQQSNLTTQAASGR